MSDPPTPHEEHLASKIEQLTDAPHRPRVENAGFMGDILNYLSKSAPIWLIRTAIILFIGYHAWIYFERAQQLSSEVGTKNADAARTEVEAAALTQKIGSDTAEAAKLKAELDKLEADAQVADVDARAAAQTVGDGPARLKELQAEMEKAQADADKAQVDIAAQQQIVDGLPLVIAQKRAEVEAAEAEAQSELNTMNLLISADASGDSVSRLMQESARAARGTPPSRPTYTIKDIFDELHGSGR